MCGIVCLFDAKQKTEILRPQVLKCQKNPSQRTGLERSFQDEKVVFSHERLAIVDPTSGKQPLFTKDGKVVLAVNGEIYNHRELKEEFPDYEFQTQSDCEVILSFIQKIRKRFC
jgi:asparagine synthase (glutamine-hydrolysing)